MADKPDDTPVDAVVQDFAKAIASEVLKAENLAKVGTALHDAIANGVKLLFAGATIVASEVVGPAVEGIIDGEKVAEGAYQRMAAKTVNSLLGTNINASDIGVFGNAESAAQKIGAGVLRGMGEASGPIEPSDENAKRFIAMMGNLAIEGWLNGVIFEQLSKIETFELAGSEKFAELKDVLIQAFGLSRLSRRVFGPYVNAVVVTPFQWHVNKTYRPELLSPAQAARQFLRGRKTRERFYEEAARAGYTDEDAEAILNSARQKLSIDDWLYLERYVGGPKFAIDEQLRDLGCNDETIAQLRLLDKTRRQRKYLEETASAIEEAYIEGHADRADLTVAFDAAYPDADERELRLNLIDARRAAKRKRLSKADIEEAVKRGLLSPIDYRDWLHAEGYDDFSATTMELLLQSEMRGAEAAEREKARVVAEKIAAANAKAAADAQRRAELEARKAAELPPLADIKNAVIRGLVTIDRYDASLAARGYATADIQFLHAMLVQDVDARLHQQEVRDGAAAHAAEKSLSLDALERSVLAGYLAIAEYDGRLKAAGYSDADRRLLVQLLTDKVAAKQDADRVAAAAAQQLAARGLSLAQAQHATAIGVWTADQYAAWLRTQQLDDVAVATLDATMRAELAQTAAAQQRRAQVAAELAVKRISLPQLEAAVLAGVTPLDAYRQTLLGAGYSTDDVDILVALLQSKLTDRAAAKAAHDRVAASAAVKHVSLAQIERAVVLGHVSFDTYDAYLSSLGYGDVDRALLHANLVDQVQQARMADATRQQLDAGDDAGAAALAAIEDDVVAGDAPMSAYRDALALRTLTPADVDALVARLQQRVDDRRGAEHLAGAVDAELHTKALSLGQWHDAVKAELRTLDDYRAFLSTQGYAVEDVDVLVTLLAQQLARAAAKAG